VTKRSATRSAVERAAARCGRRGRQERGGKNEDERESLHGVNTRDGPIEVPGAYGPDDQFPS
jgi:hypothetical protein